MINLEAGLSIVKLGPLAVWNLLQSEQITSCLYEVAYDKQCFSPRRTYRSHDEWWNDDVLSSIGNGKKFIILNSGI